MISSQSLLAASFACLVATAAVAQTADAAHASSTTTIDATKLSAHMASLGIKNPVRDNLVARLVHGHAVDSMTGADPVSTTSREQDGFSVTTTTYADGSMDERGFEIGRTATPQELKTMVSSGSLAALSTDATHSGAANALGTSLSTGITSCTRGSNAGVAYAQGCHIFYNGISASNSFDANYQLYRSGSKAQYIEGTAKFVSFVETVSNEQVNTYDNGSRIRFSFDTSFNGIGNIPGYLQLKVSPQGAVVTGG